MNCRKTEERRREKRRDGEGRECEEGRKQKKRIFKKYKKAYFYSTLPFV